MSNTGKKKRPQDGILRTIQTFGPNSGDCFAFRKDLLFDNDVFNEDRAQSIIKAIHEQFAFLRETQVARQELAKIADDLGCPRVDYYNALRLENGIKEMDIPALEVVIARLTQLRDSLEFEDSYVEDAFERATNRYERLTRNQEAGYVYVIGFDRWIKIGRTIDMRKRMAQIKLPVEPHVFAEYMVYDNKMVEANLHRLLKDKRVNGEWFELCASDFDAIADAVVPYLVAALAQTKE